MSDTHWERLLKWKREFGIGTQWQGANYTPRPLKLEYPVISIDGNGWVRAARPYRTLQAKITENMYARQIKVT